MTRTLDPSSTPELDAPEAPSSPAEIAIVVAWLRAGLEERWRALRETKTLPRMELDALLEVRAPALPLREAPLPSTIRDLGRRLGLRADEMHVLATLLACTIEPSLGRALGLLCDPLGRPFVTWRAVVDWLGRPSATFLTAEDGLTRFRLVQPEGEAIALDPTIAARLAGRMVRDPVLVGTLTLVPPRAPLPSWPLGAFAQKTREAFEAGARSVRLWIRGAEGSGRRTFFALLAEALGLRAASFASRETSSDVLRAAVRLAHLDDLALVVAGTAAFPPDLPPPLLYACLSLEPPAPPPPGVCDLSLTMPGLDRASRRAAWEAIVPAFGGFTEADRSDLVDTFAARPAQLVAVALSGARDPEAIAAMLRDEATHRLEGHAELLETPFEWDDLLVPLPLGESLRELAFEARALPALFDDASLARLFPQGRSVLALFTGPPGTGKTMAAQVIARAVGLPLFRIDLSRIVSKYIGETSQHLARLLDAARETDAILFFDEADALFGKRTDVLDAHDRYANTETDFLLQALDAWRGVAILASNKKGNIDPAFLRRMRMILEFNRPDAKERQRIWRRLTELLLPIRDRAVDAAYESLAEQIELSGAQIKSALLTARIFSGSGDPPCALEDVLRGVERELAKEGRGLSPRDRKRLLDAARA